MDQRFLFYTDFIVVANVVTIQPAFKAVLAGNALEIRLIFQIRDASFCCIGTQFGVKHSDCISATDKQGLIMSGSFLLCQAATFSFVGTGSGSSS